MRAGARPEVGSVPAPVTAGGRERHVLEILTVIEQRLERRETQQRRPGHLVVNARVLDEERVKAEV